MKRLLVLICAAAVLGLTAAPVFSGGSPESETYTIEVTGSTSVAPLMEQFADAYRDVRPEVTINISGTGSGDGITGANTGVAELGMSSRNLRSAEIGFGLDVLTVAVDAIAVVVHPDNPVSDLTVEQVRGIYTGEITSWAELGGDDSQISVVSREPGSGTRGAFEGAVGFVDELLAGAIEFDGTGGVRAAVAGNSQAIGYISLGSMNPEVKAVSVNGVEAKAERVVDGSYAVARPFLILYREAQIDPETKTFLDWMVSAEGQAIVSQNYVPVQ